LAESVVGGVFCEGKTDVGEKPVKETGMPNSGTGYSEDSSKAHARHDDR
jgi:hypothetical protein